MIPAESGTPAVPSGLDQARSLVPGMGVAREVTRNEELASPNDGVHGRPPQPPSRRRTTRHSLQRGPSGILGTARGVHTTRVLEAEHERADEDCIVVLGSVSPERQRDSNPATWLPWSCVMAQNWSGEPPLAGLGGRVASDVH